MVVVVLLFLVGTFSLFDSQFLFSYVKFLSRSNKVNSLIIIQHSYHIKLLDITTLQIKSILNDISSAKLFSRYLLAKQLNIKVKSI
jgi:hypothetical protein